MCVHVLSHVQHCVIHGLYPTRLFFHGILQARILESVDLPYILKTYQGVKGYRKHAI